MLKKYGEFEFKYNGETFKGWPSLLNISKIGSPEQIIHCVKLLSNQECQYYVARKILDACIDGDLPDFIDNKEAVDYPFENIRSISSDHVTFVVVMARHCIAYGVNGMLDIELTGGDPEYSEVSRFDPYEYIESAVELLDMSTDEAANLTLTQYMAMIAQKPWFKESQKEAQLENGFTKTEMKMWKEATGQ